MSVNFDVRGQQGMDFLLDEVLLYIMTRRDCLKLKWWICFLQTCSFWLHTQDINWWTGVVWITCGLLWCFFSCLDSDGTHSLQRIHWWASDGMLNSPYLFPWRNKPIFTLDGQCVCVKFQQIIIFGWTIPFEILYLYFVQSDMKLLFNMKIIFYTDSF